MTYCILRRTHGAGVLRDVRRPYDQCEHHGRLAAADPASRALPLERTAIHRFVQLIVARAFGVAISDLSAQSRRSARIAFARQVAMYLTHIAGQLTMTDVGRLFGRDRTTAAHACRCVEDRRDDPVFDMVLDALESAVRAWRQLCPHVSAA
mgnify:CR=1 FL=1